MQGQGPGRGTSGGRGLAEALVGAASPAGVQAAGGRQPSDTGLPQGATRAAGAKALDAATSGGTGSMGTPTVGCQHGGASPGHTAPAGVCGNGAARMCSSAQPWVPMLRKQGGPCGVWLWHPGPTACHVGTHTWLAAAWGAGLWVHRGWLGGIAWGQVLVWYANCGATLVAPVATQMGTQYPFATPV